MGEAGRRRLLVLVLPAILLAGEAHAAETRPPAINWQEAVARLAAERTRAETCAGLLKKHGDDAARDRGSLAYGEAKGEMDGVIAGLRVALAQGAGPGTLPDLQARLGRGVTAREAFCAEVKTLVPARPGERNVIVDLVSGALGPLIEAVQALWLDARERDRLTASTIDTQLQAATWPTFAAIPPAS